MIADKLNLEVEDEKDMLEDQITLQEQFCKEYYSKNKNYLPKDQKGINIIYYYKEYSRCLENKLKNIADKSF